MSEHQHKMDQSSLLRAESSSEPTHATVSSGPRFNRRDSYGATDSERKDSVMAPPGPTKINSVLQKNYTGVPTGVAPAHSPGVSKGKILFEAAHVDTSPHIWVTEQEVGKHATMKTFHSVNALFEWTRDAFTIQADVSEAPKPPFSEAPKPSLSETPKPSAISSKPTNEPKEAPPPQESRVQLLALEGAQLEVMGIPRVPTSYGHDDLTTNWRAAMHQGAAARAASVSSISSIDTDANVKTSDLPSFTTIDQSPPRVVHSSCSSSSTSCDDAAVITRSYWLDVQSDDLDVIEQVLAMFPVEDDCLDRMTVMQDADTLQVCASENYVALNVQCKRARTSTPPAKAKTEETGAQPWIKRPFRPQHFLADPTTQAACSILLFEDWIVTVHSTPVAGLSDLLRKIDGKYGGQKMKRLKAQARLATLTPPVTPAGLPATPAGHGPPSFSPPILVDAAGRPDLMRTSWVCAMLVDFIISHTLPDPSPLLAEADACDEMSLLTAMDDQMDMLLRISGLRRNISQQQRYLYQKEKLLNQFLAPELRTTFVARHNTIAEVYSRAEGQVVRIAERLNAARDIMSHASSNLASNVSLEQAAASNQMNRQMKVLSQVASICLPLNIVTGAFGMNVAVPFQADSHPGNLSPFVVICVGMALWLVLSFASIVYFGKRKYQNYEANALTRM